MEEEEEEEEERRRADGPVQIDSETGSEECSLKDKVLYCCGCEGSSVTRRTRGPQRARVLWCQCPPSPHPPALAYCDSCFLISQTQSSVTQTVYLACLPQPRREKERREREKKNRHTSQDLGTKIILHNTREFKEALPTPP